MLPQLVIGTDLVVTTSTLLAQYHASILPVRLIGVPVTTAMPVVHAQWPRHRDNDPFTRWLVDLLLAHVDWQGGRIG